jgi:Rrf2 family cysteine metabolism transcriptional repressor
MRSQRNTIFPVKISTRSRYGLRAIMELALHDGEGPVMMQSIADIQGVSRKYLDTIFASLKNAGLIRSRRGVGGGHVLARPADEIRVGDILRAVEGPVTLVDCVRDPTYCKRVSRCATRDVWARVTEAIDAVLDGMTLADLVQTHESKTADDDAEEPASERCLLE